MSANSHGLTENDDMETNPGFQSVGNQQIDSQRSAAAAPGAKASKTLEPVTPEFVLDSIRCDVESRLHERLSKDEDLLARIKALAEEREQGRVQTRLALMTDCYHVD